MKNDDFTSKSLVYESQVLTRNKLIILQLKWLGKQYMILKRI